MEHSKTPWRIEPATKKDNWRIVASNGQVVSTFSGNMDMDNARRIVACVNACEGSETIALEQIANSGGLARIFSERAEYSAMAGRLEQQRDQLQQQLATERASLFAENQRKQQLERQVAELVAALKGVTLTQEDIDMGIGAGEEQHAEARAVIQKVRGGEWQE